MVEAGIFCLLHTMVATWGLQWEAGHVSSVGGLEGACQSGVPAEWGVVWLELGPLRRHSHTHSPQGRQHCAAYGPHFGPLALLDGSTCAWSASSTTPSAQKPQMRRWSGASGATGGRGVHIRCPLKVCAHQHQRARRASARPCTPRGPRHRRRRRELGAWHRPAKEDVTLDGLHLDLRHLSMLGRC